MQGVGGNNSELDPEESGREVKAATALVECTEAVSTGPSSAPCLASQAFQLWEATREQVSMPLLYHQSSSAAVAMVTFSPALLLPPHQEV